MRRQNLFNALNKVPNVVSGGYARELQENIKAAQEKLIRDTIKDKDIVICTAAIPGKPSPKLVSTEMVKSMKSGSVVVDLATEFGDRTAGWGGNVECSEADKEILIDGVTVIGRSKIEVRMPTQASELFSMNLANLLEDMGGGERFVINMDDEVISALCVVRDGQITWIPPERRPPPTKTPTPERSARPSIVDVVSKEVPLLRQIIESDLFFTFCLFATAAFAALLGATLDTLELKHITLFILSLIVGYYW